MTDLLNATDLSKTFPEKSRGKGTTALSHVSFSLAPGESLGVVGESGCGKTTLARILSGFLTPDQGSLLWEGRPFQSLTRDERASKIQLIFQDPFSSLNPKLSVHTTLGEALVQRARWDHGPQPSRKDLDERVRETLSAVGLPRDAGALYPHQFSGGQRQRVAMARALAAGPQLLIADEPVSALDLSVQAQILNLLADLREKLGLSLILISHDLAVVQQMTDRVLVMAQGRVVEEGVSSEVLANPQAPETQTLLSAVPVLLR